MRNIIRRRRWSWVGHVLRMEGKAIPKTAVHWTPEVKRQRGRPRTTWRRTIESELKTLNYTWGDIEKKAHELWAKEKLKREPKYSFEKSRDEKDDDVSDELWAKVKLNREPKYSFEKWSDEEDDDVSAAKQGVFQTNSAKEKLGRKVSAPGNVNSRQSSEKVSHSKQF
ncbi:hypothetical protein ACROYT_G029793 [Oculina patagonica]